jgi:hypothetical protein
MSKPLGYSFIKEGANSLDLEPSDLFDKVINLKLMRKKGRPIIIRSDYEAVFQPDGSSGKVSFKRCTHKPEIKVSYKQVAQSVAVEVDIKITNFFLDGIEERTGSMFTAEGDPVQWCVIQMGYRKQFIDFTSEAHKNDVEGFYDLKIPESGNLWQQINVQILTGYRESYPPDNVTYFKGVIGTMEAGLRWTHTEADLVPGYGDPQFPKQFGAIESMLYQLVTRRFIRPSVQHLVIQEPQGASPTESFKQQVVIYGYSKYVKQGDDAMERLEASKKRTIASLSFEDAKELQLLENGIMSIEDANTFGVICACSNTLRTLPVETILRYGVTEDQAAAIGNVSLSPFNDTFDTLGGQLSAIQQHYPFLRWFVLTDGSFYFYHVRDKESDLWMDDYINYMRQKNTLPLPAIYDITPSGTRTIRCPFISFLSPMTTVQFQSRYNLGTLTSFYYPVKTRSFLVILASVEFSTTGDENVMELMCVDVPDDSIIPKLPTPVATPEVAKMQEERNLQWQQTELVVVRHKTNATETDSSWNNIVKNEIVPRRDLTNYPELVEYSEKQALEFLRDANLDYFKESSAYMSRGNSIENDPSGIGGRTGIKVPWLKEYDKIILRDPVRLTFKSDEYYPPDQEVTD